MRRWKGYKGATSTVYYYSLTRLGETKILTLENLEKDFSSFPDFIAKVKRLRAVKRKALSKPDENGHYLINTIFNETVKS
ncbi:MAG: hypothetical protein IPJ20_14425 [Flammeovirgaceae bacterium]|nr:hypothetical protein [Flammeovirgaceae bacterium]